MIATYSQSTQTRITSTINNYMQTDMFTLNTSATQTRPFQSNQTTQTYPQQNTQAIHTDLGLNGNLTLTLLIVLHLLMYMMKMYQLITLVQTGREKAIKNRTLPNIHTTNKESR